MPPDRTDAAVPLGGFSFDPATLELLDADGRRVALRLRSLVVLRCLAEQRGRIVGRDELMRSAWPDVIVTDDSLTQCIGEIRSALNDNEHRLVQTEPKRGYRLVEEQAAPTSRAATRAFEQQVRFLTTADGVRLAYATSGDGPTFVRAPHWMTHIDWEWRNPTVGPWIQGLSSRCRYVRYDARGCGLSDRDTAAATLDVSVADLEAVIDAACPDACARPRRSVAATSGRSRCLCRSGAAS